MGLSNEERLSQFLWGVQGWREKVVELQAALGVRETKARRIVGRWIRRIDEMMGVVVQGMNLNFAFWATGENETSFHGLLADPERISADAEQRGSSIPEVQYESAGWWHDNVDVSFVAWRLNTHPYKTHEGLRPLAAWWDQYACVSNLIYLVWRYDDGLFSARFKKEFQALIGEMANLRFKVCFEAGDASEALEVEKYLLLKVKAFHLLLSSTTAKLKGTAYFEKTFDGYALLDRVAKLTAKEMKILFDAEAKRKMEWTRKYHDDEEAKKVEKTSGLFGPALTVKAEEPVPCQNKAKAKKR